MRLILVLIGCLSLLSPVSFTRAEQTLNRTNVLDQEMVHYPSGTPLQFRSQVRYRYWGFSVYDVAFYTKGSSDLHDPYASSGVLVLRYLRDISREDFARAAESIISAHDKELFSRIQPALTKWNEFLEAVESGDTYAMHFGPEGTLTLFKNGTLKGTLNDSRFARAYLDIWLGEYSVLGTNRLRLFGQPRGGDL